MIKNKFSTASTLKLFINKDSKIKGNIIGFLLSLSITSLLGGCVVTKTMNIKNSVDRCLDSENTKDFALLKDFYRRHDLETNGIETNKILDQEGKTSKKLKRCLSNSDLNTPKNRLIREHVMSLMLYVDNKPNYEVINKVLRFGKVGPYNPGSIFHGLRGQELTQAIDNVIHYMIEAYSLMKLVRCKTYRGTSTATIFENGSKPGKIFLAEVARGDSFTDKGFVSTTMNRNVAYDDYADQPMPNPDSSFKILYTHKRPDCREQIGDVPVFYDNHFFPVLMTIHNAVGINVANLSYYPEDEEVLLPPNTTFHVYGVNKEDPVWNIKVFATPNTSIKRSQSLDCLPNQK